MDVASASSNAKCVTSGGAAPILFKDVDSGGASSGANNVVVTGGCGGAAAVVGGEVDAIGADDGGTLYVASGGVVTVVDKGGEGAMGECAAIGGGAVDSQISVSGGANNVSGGVADVSGGDVKLEPLNSIEVITGVGRGADGDAHTSTNNSNEVKGEKEKGSGSITVGGETGGAENVSGGGAENVSGWGADANEDGGANVGSSVRSNVGSIPQIPRSRLREILQHAEGECIMLKCMFHILYRWWSLWNVLGNVLSLG